jgi:hypothetical protein
MSDIYAHNKVNTMASNITYYGDTDELILFTPSTLPTRMIDHPGLWIPLGNPQVSEAVRILYPDNILCPDYIPDFENDGDSDIPLLIY